MPRWDATLIRLRPHGLAGGLRRDRWIPVRWHVDVRTIERSGRLAAEQLQRTHQFRPQDLDRARDACFTRGSEAVRVCAPDEDRACPKTQRLGDVAAAPDAAVDKHFCLSVHRLEHFRQRAQRRRYAIELAAAVIRHHEGLRAGRDRLPRVFTGVHALDDDGALPEVANPPKIRPGHDRLRQGGADVRISHRAFRQDDVWKVHQPAVRQEAGEPARPRQHLRHERQLFPERSADQFLDTVANVALALSGDRGIDGEDQRRESRRLRSGNAGGRDVPSADEIHLIPGRSARRRSDVLEPASGQRGQDVGRPGGAGSFRRCDFATRIEQPAAADGREQERQVEGGAQHGRPQIRAGCRDGAARPEREARERQAVLPQRDLVICAAVDVVEREPWETALREAAQVRDVDDARGGYRSRHLCAILLKTGGTPMLARRRMLGTTLFGGLLGSAIPASLAARSRTAAEAEAGHSEQGTKMSDSQVTRIVDALKDVSRAVEAPHGAFVETMPIRQKQMDYLKATNKFPDFIDVGLDVWFAIHDWHIKHLQQPVLGRDANGRYTISVMGTQLVMRPDLVPTFISAPYDSR